MKKRITLTIDPDLDDFLEATGFGKSRFLEVTARRVKAAADGELTDNRVYSVRCGEVEEGWGLPRYLRNPEYKKAICSPKRKRRRD